MELSLKTIWKLHWFRMRQTNGYRDSSLYPTNIFILQAEAGSIQSTVQNVGYQDASSFWIISGVPSLNNISLPHVNQQTGHTAGPFSEIILPYGSQDKYFLDSSRRYTVVPNPADLQKRSQDPALSMGTWVRMSRDPNWQVIIFYFIYLFYNIFIPFVFLFNDLVHCPESHWLSWAAI